MLKTKVLVGIATFALVLAITLTTGPTANAGHVFAVGLGTAEPFAILAGTPNITDSPTSVISGNVGLSPASGAGIGLLCTQVTGTIYSVDAAGPLPCRQTDPGLLTLAKASLTTAIGDAAGRLGGLPVAANQLAGKTLTHGVYNSAAAMDLAAGGLLTLDAQGDPGAVWIFQLGTLLTVNNASTVRLINNAQSCNVFWKVDSATIGTTAAFKGTILAATSITVANGSTIDGRLLAGTGSVTLINDTITKPNCSAPAVMKRCPSGLLIDIDLNCPTASPAPTATATVAPTASPTPSAAIGSVTLPTATPGPASLPSTTTSDAPPLAALGLMLGALGAAALLMRTRRPRLHR